jgi:hypothetical protein
MVRAHLHGWGERASAAVAGCHHRNARSRRVSPVSSPATAMQLGEALWDARDAEELPKVRRRLADDEEAFGLRMGELFAIAKRAADLPLGEVHRLLDHPAYEPRMAAMCILDFPAPRRLPDDRRRALCDTHPDRHARITAWEMVDRAAPRVVGGYLAGRDLAPLQDLARSDAPLQRRTAITAPLYFMHNCNDDDLAGGFALAARLADDPDGARAGRDLPRARQHSGPVTCPAFPRRLRRPHRLRRCVSRSRSSTPTSAELRRLIRGNVPPQHLGAVSLASEPHGHHDVAARRRRYGCRAVHPRRDRGGSAAGRPPSELPLVSVLSLGPGGWILAASFVETRATTAADTVGTTMRASRFSSPPPPPGHLRSDR